MMNGCDFDKLVKLLDKGLGLDEKIEVLNHLDMCEICRDAIYHISVDRDRDFFLPKPAREEWKVA
jgi:hypothetical protein